MADNSTLPVSVGTEVFANDDISSVKYPRVKLTWGPDGTANDADVATGKPIPTQIRTSTGVAASFGAGATDTGTQRVVLASEQVEGGEYEDVLASATSQMLGSTGAQGDYISGLLIVPETTTPGTVTLQDGNITAFVVFVGGASSVSNLIPFWVPLGHISVSATTPGWKVTTGTNVHVRAVGNFT